MSDPKTPVALEAAAVPPRAWATRYPPPLAHLAAGREKRALGDAFGLKAFGVNLTRLAPGAQSAFRHRHTSPEPAVGTPPRCTRGGSATERAAALGVVAPAAGIR